MALLEQLRKAKAEASGKVWGEYRQLLEREASGKLLPGDPAKLTALMETLGLTEAVVERDLHSVRGFLSGQAEFATKADQLDAKVEALAEAEAKYKAVCKPVVDAQEKWRPKIDEADRARRAAQYSLEQAQAAAEQLERLRREYLARFSENGRK